jgi:hypothetical protein
MSETIKGRLAGVAVGLVVTAAALAVWGAARSEAVIAIIKPPELVGAATLAGGERAGPHVRVGLPCPGEDVGFNPQPDPPGIERARLTLTVAGDRYELDEVRSSACTADGPAMTHAGTGTASCGSDVGFIVNWRITDAGLGGPDTAEVGIESPGEAISCSNNLRVGGQLADGNLRTVRRVLIGL